jgi:hypothetical protein
MPYHLPCALSEATLDPLPCPRPMDARPPQTPRSGHLFDSVVDMAGLTERNNLAATMFLAAAALMYVVAAELPKVSYLTTMDIFVFWNLLIQFSSEGCRARTRILGAPWSPLEILGDPQRSLATLGDPWRP